MKPMETDLWIDWGTCDETEAQDWEAVLNFGLCACSKELRPLHSCSTRTLKASWQRPKPKTQDIIVDCSCDALPQILRKLHPSC